MSEMNLNAGQVEKNALVNPDHWTGVTPSNHETYMTGRPTRSYEETYTCICCPLGCDITVTLEQSNEGLDVTNALGAGCRRGKDYARQEATHPVRMITAAVPVAARMMPASVKTNVAVPKNRMRHVLDAIGALSLVAPVHEGDVLIADVCGTGANVVATKTVL